MSASKTKDQENEVDVRSFGTTFEISLTSHTYITQKKRNPLFCFPTSHFSRYFPSGGSDLYGDLITAIMLSFWSNAKDYHLYFTTIARMGGEYRLIHSKIEMIM